LQKIIARAGIASRRHAEELIRSGQVRVNGVVVTELGAKADPERDRVEAAGQTAEQPAESKYYILNKPPHVVSTLADPEGRATLRHVLRGLAGGVFPVGRLDYAASGLMLLTTDGRLADAIFKVSARLPQVYWIKLKGRPTEETLAQVSRRAQARLRLLRAPGAAAGHSSKPGPANPWYEAEFRGARRDLLRQALFAAGHPVEKIRRVKLGPLELGELPEGHYQQLSAFEVARLRRAVERAGESRGGWKGSTAAGEATDRMKAQPGGRPVRAAKNPSQRKWNTRWAKQRVANSHGPQLDGSKQGPKPHGRTQQHEPNQRPGHGPGHRSGQGPRRGAGKPGRGR
jgi:pseudouridine synthase